MNRRRFLMTMGLTASVMVFQTPVQAADRGNGADFTDCRHCSLPLSSGVMVATDRNHDDRPDNNYSQNRR